ncbi:MAG: ORF6N domain-containing protein, partial [Ruminococcus sp.]|nr:ORF6N domain-containing protein [Ruminococcus sp.]
MYELINNKYIEIKEYKGQRVVTFRDIDTVHERPDGTASRNFRANRKHFIEGVDYFSINQPDEFRRVGLTRPQGGTPETVILLTVSGYLMIVKSFTDDLAWSVQRMLVNSYFKLQQTKSTEKYSNITKSDIIE